MVILKKLPVVLAILVLVYGIYFSINLNKTKSDQNFQPLSEPIVVQDANSGSVIPTVSQIPTVSVIAEGLDTPWAIAFLPASNASQSDAGWPDNSILVTERKGTIRIVKNGVLQAEPVAQLSAVKETGEGGLQGIAIHPNFVVNRFVYVYYTYGGDTSNTLNRVSRFYFDGENIVNETVIVDNIPGASNHDGGRIKFGPDGKLYITTGDAQEPSLSQNVNSLAGKILRVNDDGSAAAGNPFDNRTYSYGHRNPQGIVWDNNGQLWSTEHGPSGVQTGNDEFNKIEVGRNYGWPEIKGKQTHEGMETPIIESGFLNAWAPAGLAYLEGKFYFAGLRGAALYELDEGTTNLKTHFKNEFGRLRDVVVGPDNMLYVTTSNLDGRGTPKDGDDKLLKINPSRL